MKFSLSPSHLTAATLAAAFAAGPLTAQAAYGTYAAHEVDLATPLAAGGANVTNNSWVNLASVAQGGVAGVTGTGGFPGSAPWVAPVASQVNTALGTVGAALGGATLNKVANGISGGPYAAGGSMYFGGFSGDINNNGGTLRVSDSTPIADLASVVFQLGFGEAWTYDFYNKSLPTLSYTTASGVTSGLSASFSEYLEKFDNGTVAMPTGEEAIYINQYGLQWDLSSVNQPITSFSIDFTGVQHAQLYGLTLTQSDRFTQVVDVTVAAPVPEPETYALMLAGLGALAFVARRRQRVR